MADEEQDGAPEHPALKNFNRTVETVKHVVVSTLKTGLKGALVGGLALGAASVVLGSPLMIAGMLPVVGATASGAAGSLTGSWLLTGALMGAGIGGAVGLVSGVNSAEDVVNERAEELVAKDNRRLQLAANQEMMQMNMERQRAMARSGGMAIQPQNQLPMGAALAARQGAQSLS